MDTFDAVKVCQLLCGKNIRQAAFVIMFQLMVVVSPTERRLHGVHRHYCRYC